MASSEYATDRPLQRMRVDMTGKRFGRLVGLRPSHVDRHKRVHWFFRCDCGKETRASGREVRKGDTRSCGCLALEAKRLNTRTHGDTYSPEWRAWMAMKRRCQNQNTVDYANYGGRGITVYVGWQSSFPAFLACVGRRPSPAHSLDRIDNNRGYEPGNVRWATRAEQNKNRRKATELDRQLRRAERRVLCGLMLTGLLTASRHNSIQMPKGFQ